MSEPQDKDKPTWPTVDNRRRRSPWQVDIPNKTADCNATLDAIIHAMDRMAEISGDPELAYHRPESAAPPAPTEELEEEPEEEPENEPAEEPEDEPEKEPNQEPEDEPELSKEEEEKARMDILQKKLDETFAGSLEHVNDKAVRGAIEHLYILCALQVVYIRDVVLPGKVREAEALVKAVRAAKPVNTDNLLAAVFIKNQYEYRIAEIKKDPEPLSWYLMPFRPRLRMPSKRKGPRTVPDTADTRDGDVGEGSSLEPSDHPDASIKGRTTL